MLLSPQKIRWSGWLLFIGSLLSILALLVELTVAVFPIIPACASVIGGLLVAVGLPSTYIKQRDVIGILGRIGFLLLLVTWFLTMLGVNITDIVVIATVAHPTTSSIPPLIANTINLASMLMLIGTLLYGVLTLRARIFPSSVGWLMISTVIVITLSLFVASLFAQLLYAIGELLLLSAFARMGYLLARWPDDIEPEPVESEEVGTMSD
ncbi:MAG: hypothetical protein JO215_14105 [Ktedonobacteraceae bacterium]|nr:hypothetical protein [Ktedonobacteraceae bacterium]